MTVPQLHLSPVAALESSAEVLVLGVLSTPDGPVLAGVGEGWEPVQRSLGPIGFSGGKDEFRRIPALVGAASGLALVGLGSGTPDAARLRYAAGTAARGLVGVGAIALALPAEDDAALAALLEGAAIGSYSYTVYRSIPGEDAVAPSISISVLAQVDEETGAELVARATAVAGSVHLVRDLVNMPPSDLYPESFARLAAEAAAGSHLEITTLDEKDLVEGGYGGLVGVGQGSTRGPRLVKVAYDPGQGAPHLALVGKGITFDSGGLSLKPAASMVGMKYDMTGAATVLAVVVAAAELALPVRVTAWLCLAENMPSGSAIRPNDVLRIRGGSSVEVLNTDAEGRLVLADGLVAAGEEQPDAIIDIATLTGAAIVAMGPRYVATMGDESLVGEVVSAAGRVDEPFWPMPLPEEMRSLLDSDVADIANAKIGNTAGGMLLAGIFLRDFVPARADGTGPIPWAHLDIAGAANNSAGGYGFTGKGPTGIAVRTLLEVATAFARR